MIRRRAGDGPLILWIHGYTLDGSIWEPIWDCLPSFEHVAIDLPGHGAALRAPGQGMLAASIATIIVAARDTGARRLAAMSFGGAVALEVLTRQPELFDAALLAAPGVLGGPVDPISADRHLELLALARQRGLGPWLADRWLQSPPDIFTGLRARPERFAPIANVVRRHRFEELIDHASEDLARPGPQLEGFSKDLRLTLLLGENDMPAFKRCAELIRRAKPGARRVWLSDVGHQPLLEAPQESSEVVLAALS